ncbi:hypothetical protein [Streptomyces kaniharaensis]|uniref:hypothetical protein n=1 Tax=Streptomyces kaniharaensis TaxID=212423 RepID=UPI0018A83071|nr:hypothetical protein [Streptomyces kaniharaensis]
MAAKKKAQDIGELILSSNVKGDDTNTNTARRRSATLSQAAAAAKRTTSPKYVQLRGDQQIELDVVARELQASRVQKTERITANTVIRVAVDAVLARRGLLAGDTEEQLLASWLGYVKGLEEEKAKLLKSLEKAEAKLLELEEIQGSEDR